MNVTFCIPYLVIGGVDMVFIRTLQELKKQSDVNITILTHAKIGGAFFKDWCAQNPDIQIITYYPLQNVFEKIAQYTKIFPLKNIRKIIFSLYKKFKRWQIRHNSIFTNTDIFIDYKNMNFARELANVTKPKIAWIHGSINFFEDEKLGNKLSMYDKIVCLTDSFATDFKTRYPQHTNKIIRIYNPIDCDAIRNTAKTQSVVDGKYFVVVSRLNHDKDIKTVIDAFDKFWVRADKPDVRLIIIGGGNQEAYLQSVAKQKTSAQNIVFTGSIPQPFGYMRGAMANILSSYNEGFGMVLIEAIALGTLNISSDCPNGPAEILLNGDAGILFTPGDAEKLSQIMSDVYNERIDTNKIISRATDSLKRFDNEKIIPQIQDILSQQLQRNII